MARGRELSSRRRLLRRAVGRPPRFNNRLALETAITRADDTLNRYYRSLVELERLAGVGLMLAQSFSNELAVIRDVYRRVEADLDAANRREE